jgi:cytochrome c oxidase subunit 2
MNFQVIAHAPDDFERWKERQQSEPLAPEQPPAVAGKQLFMSLTCSQCHAIAGTDAQGAFAPNLTHVAGRAELGAGVIANSPENLRIWLHNPQALKPGCKMPNFKLSDEQLNQLVAYLETLQ